MNVDFPLSNNVIDYLPPSGPGFLAVFGLIVYKGVIFFDKGKSEATPPSGSKVDKSLRGFSSS